MLRVERRDRLWLCLHLLICHNNAVLGYPVRSPVSTLGTVLAATVSSLTSVLRAGRYKNINYLQSSRTKYLGQPLTQLLLMNEADMIVGHISPQQTLKV